MVHSNLVIFGPFCPLWLYSVHLGPIRPIQFIHFYSVHFGPFDSIRSTYMVLFSPLQFIWFYLVHFIQFSVIRSFCFLFINFGPYWCTYIMRKDIFELRAPILNPNLLYIYIYIDLKLVISKILYIVFIVTTLLFSHINIEFQSTLV